MVAWMNPVSEPERRNERRRALPTSVAYLSAHRLLIARAGDVSFRGAFLRTIHPDPVGTRATVDVEIDGERKQVTAEVVRVSFASGREGMGIAFLEEFCGEPDDGARAMIDRPAHG